MHHHAHTHTNSHDHDFNSMRHGNRRGLIIALAITAGIMVLEFFGGLITNSLALLSDSGHMLSDTTSLLLSLLAMYFASKPASKNKTYGFYRFEILAALFNGITLFIIAIFIVIEAYKRFIDPSEVGSLTMIIIAGIGLIANLLSAWFLMKNGDVKENLNVKSAYLHVLGDALGSIGAIIAGIIMLLTDWFYADPIISVVVAIIILKSSTRLIKQTFNILMEGSPSTIDVKEIKNVLSSIDGVDNVHDVHVWTITSDFNCFSCHLTISDNKDAQSILQTAISKIEEKFQIKHSTIQIEKAKMSKICHQNLV